MASGAFSSSALDCILVPLASLRTKAKRYALKFCVGSMSWCHEKKKRNRRGQRKDKIENRNGNRAQTMPWTPPFGGRRLDRSVITAFDPRQATSQICPNTEHMAPTVNAACD